MNLQCFQNQEGPVRNEQDSETVQPAAARPLPSGNRNQAGSGRPLWEELIRRSQNRDAEATQTLLRQFNALLEHEAYCLMRQGLCPEYQDAKSEAVLLFLEFIHNFHGIITNDASLPGLIKTYLHNERMDMAAKKRRHCPDGYSVDFEKEIEENTPFSQQFPCCETAEDERLYHHFTKHALEEALNQLTKKEIYIIKKHFLENKPPSQIAAALHCSPRYVRKVRQEALAKMRRYLETHYPDFRIQ